MQQVRERPAVGRRLVDHVFGDDLGRHARRDVADNLVVVREAQRFRQAKIEQIAIGVFVFLDAGLRAVADRRSGQGDATPVQALWPGKTWSFFAWLLAYDW